MVIDHVHTYQTLKHLDPSRTTALRNAFSKALRRRFTELRFLIWEVVVDDDVFGLVESQSFTALTARPGKHAFAHSRNADKVKSFMSWLQNVIDTSLLQLNETDRLRQTTSNAWTNRFIRDAYNRGRLKARAQMGAVGIVPPAGMRPILNVNLSLLAKKKTTPKKKKLVKPKSPLEDRLLTLEKQVFNELRGITKDMAKNISKVLAQGLKNGDSPKTIAKKINNTIKKLGKDLGMKDTLGRYISAEVRADMMARTEIIRAHAEAQLQEFKDWGLQGVSVKAEFITAGDARVCSICAKHEKQVFTIAEARGLIPLHPRCRCIWLPFNADLANARNRKK